MHLCVMWRINWPNQALQTDRGPCSDSETPSSARALRLSWVVRRRRGVTGWATLFGGQLLCTQRRTLPTAKVEAYSSDKEAYPLPKKEYRKPWHV